MSLQALSVTQTSRLTRSGRSNCRQAADLIVAAHWAQYPLSGAWAMGTLLGIKLFLVGLVMIASGSAVRSLARA